MDQKVQLLFSALGSGGSIPEEGRQLAAVMLRRTISSEWEEFFVKVRQTESSRKRRLANDEDSNKIRRDLVFIIRQWIGSVYHDSPNSIPASR